MAGYFPAPPPPPSVTSDSPLHISGDARLSSVIAGVAPNLSRFTPIGSELPPVIPTGAVLPLPNALPQGYPFHVLGTAGIKCVEGDTGGFSASTGFAGPAGPCPNPFYFGDASGVSATVTDDPAVLSGDGRFLAKIPPTHNATSKLDLTVPDFATTGYFASIRATLVPPDNNDIPNFTIGFGLTFGDNAQSIGVFLASNYSAPFLAYSVNAGAQVNIPGSVTAPVDVLISMSISGTNTFTYSITGMPSGDVSNTIGGSGSPSSGAVVAEFNANGTFTGIPISVFEDAWNASGITDLSLGQNGNKVWV